MPVLRDADSKSLRTIAAETRDLAERARAGKLRQTEIEGGTFTVSNMGMLGVSAFAAIINPPESAILAVSATIQRPVVRDGGVTVGDDHVRHAVMRPPRVLRCRRRPAAPDREAPPRGADAPARMTRRPAVHSI